MKKVKTYSDKFKKNVVNEVLSGRISIEGIKRKYGIGGSNTVPRWIRKHRASQCSFTFMSKNEKKTVEQLQLEIEQLKLELDYEKLKSEAFHTMIDLAEDEFKIPIRKKSGAKPSKK